MAFAARQCASGSDPPTSEMRRRRRCKSRSNRLACKMLRSTDDTVIGRSLALMVQDSAEPLQIRQKAYRGLLIIRGLPIFETIKEPHFRIHEYSFPEDADWNLINSFLDDSRDQAPVDPIDAAMPHLSESDRECLRSYMQAEKAFGAGQDEEVIRLLTRAMGESAQSRSRSSSWRGHISAWPSTTKPSTI